MDLFVHEDLHVSHFLVVGRPDVGFCGRVVYGHPVSGFATGNESSDYLVCKIAN